MHSGVTDEDAWLPAAPVHGETWSQLAATAYAGVRDGGLTPDAGFDLAAFLMDWAVPQAVFAELAEACVAGNRTDLAAIAGQALDAVGYVPGFGTEPRLLAVLQQALDNVTPDLRAAGQTGAVRLAEPDADGLGSVWVSYAGQYGSTSGLGPADAACPDASVLLARVADELQDAVMETLSAVWPVCPEHPRGAHPQVRHGEAVWWCSGGGGHVICAIGRWAS